MRPVMSVVLTLAVALATADSAESQSSGTALSWPPPNPSLRTLASIVGPEGLEIRRVFAAGEAPFFNLAELGVIPDGRYRYSLRALSDEDLAEGPEHAEMRRLYSLRAAHAFGSFEVRGAVVVPLGRDRGQASMAGAPRAEGGTTEEGIQPPESAVTDTGDSPSLELRDDTAQGGGTEDDWIIQADGFFFGDEDLGIFWEDGESMSNSSPILIQPEINNFALVFDARGTTSTAELGINTATPLATVHVVSDLIPDVRFDDISGTTYVWEVAADDTGFRVLDVTAGSSVGPFAIEGGVSDLTLYLDGQTDGVGIGTDAPVAKLHVAGGAVIDGDVTLGSSRSLKHELEAVSVEKTLDALLTLPLYRWKYRDDDLQATHLGPMAEQFHARFGLGRDDKHLSPADSAGLALAAIQGLHGRLEDRVSELADANRRLAAENARLAERLAEVERALEAQRPIE